MDRREFLKITAAIPVVGFLKPQKNEKYFIFSMPLLQVDVPNKNNRIYPKKVIEKAIQDCHEVFGGIDFTEFEKGKILFSKVSHVVANLRLEKDCLWGDIKLLKTPNGKVLKKLLETTPKEVAFRTSGIGEIKMVGTTWVIQDSFKLVSVSAVNIDKAA